MMGSCRDVRAYKEVWLFVEVRESLDRRIVVELLTVLLRIEISDSPNVTIPLHICYWRADQAELLHKKKTEIRFNTNAGALAEHILKEAERINGECVEPKDAQEETELVSVEQKLRWINQKDLAVFVAAQSLADVRVWIEPWEERLKRKSLSLIAITPEKLEVTFGNTVWGKNRICEAAEA